MRPEFLLCIILLMAPMSGHAVEALLYEDFQDGNSDGWQGFGDGIIGITEYQGNASLQLTQGTAVARQVFIAANSRVRLGASFAAADLGDDGACIAEVTFDDGNNWSNVSRLVSGQDDSITLFNGAISYSVSPGIEYVWLRARVAGNSKSARCWLDNVYVVGDRAPEENEITRKLSGEFLLGNENFATPVSMREFTQPADATLPEHSFSGLLKLVDVSTAGSINILQDAFGRQSDVGEPLAHLPEFNFEFAQSGHDLLPLQRGVQRREHPYWEIILQPGRAWKEEADGEWSRAAVPFSLQERSANCTHNGVLTWLFNADEVSRVAYQISSETCGYLKLDLWGVVAAEYSKKDLSESSQPHFERLEAHRSSRLPVRDLAQLATDYPGVEPLSFGFDEGIHPDDLSVLGMVVDGIHYRSDCFTRMGPYPFCDSMPLPSYSTAKSIFAAVALMRMEQLLPGISETPIADAVEQCDMKKWRDVSVEHALDMATGNYRSKQPEIDEDAVPSRRFIFDDSHDSKIEFACEQYRRKVKPGTQFVYHTSDTYLLGDALQSLLRRRTDFTDVYRDLLVDPIWRPLQLSPLLDDSKRTYDEQARPFAGYGLTYEADDIARIARWLSENNGTLDDAPMLDQSMLDAALQRSEDDRGLDAGYPNLRYNNGFWAYDAGPSLGCEEPAWVPFMSGVSGITVAMFSNGITYYYYSDSYVFRWQSAREAAHTIKDLCQ